MYLRLAWVASPGEQPLRDATRAGAARRLDAAAALAGRAADLLSEAAALRLKFPKLSQLRWTPAEGGEGLGRLRLGFLCLQSGARLHADLAVGAHSAIIYPRESTSCVISLQPTVVVPVRISAGTTHAHVSPPLATCLKGKQVLWKERKKEKRKERKFRLIS